MKQTKYVYLLFALLSTILTAETATVTVEQHHQVPDEDGIYYVGPEVTPPTLVRTLSVPYPTEVQGKDVQGMTVLAMIIDPSGTPSHIQLLHTHGELFDKSTIAAVEHSAFAPGTLAGKPVPVWIDVRVVFHADRSLAVPQVMIAERDLPLPDESHFFDKHRRPLSFTPPFVIHTVDASFADPFIAHPYVQEAVVEVLVSEKGLPTEVRVSRGLGFGLDKKAEAAVWQYRFFPATKRGQPVASRRRVMVDFADF